MADKRTMGNRAQVTLVVDRAAVGGIGAHTWLWMVGSIPAEGMRHDYRKREIARLRKRLQMILATLKLAPDFFECPGDMVRIINAIMNGLEGASTASAIFHQHSPRNWGINDLEQAAKKAIEAGQIIRITDATKSKKTVKTTIDETRRIAGCG